LTNGAEYYADAVRERHLPDMTGRPSFVEQYLTHTEDTEAEHMRLVTFDAVGSPNWGEVPPGIMDVIGQYAEPGRGSEFKPEPSKPARGVTRWVDFPVAELPRPQRLFRAACMESGIKPAVQRWLWRRGRGTCGCWYHQVNWAVAASAALRALQKAFAEAEVASDAALSFRFKGRAVDLLDLAMDSASPTAVAARTLILGPIKLDPDLDDYVNGQHRSQALMDQGVARVPVTVWIPAGEERDSVLDFIGAGASVTAQTNVPPPMT